jgi:O-antigen ligase
VTPSLPQRLSAAPWRSLAGAGVVGAAIYWAVVSFTRQADDQLLRPLLAIFAAASALLLGASAGGLARWRVTPSQWGWTAALVAAWGVSTLLSDAPARAGQRFVLYLGLGMLGSAVYMLHRGRDDTRAWPYLLAMASVHAFVLAQVVFWLAEVHPGGPVERVPFHGNIRHFGHLGYLGAATATALWMTSPRLSLTALVLGTAGLFGMILLGSRGGLVAWAACVAVAIVACQQQRFRMVCLSALALVLAVSAVWAVGDDIPSASLLVRAKQAGDMLRTHDRMALWRDAMSGIARKPLLGHGPDGHTTSRCCHAPAYTPGTVQPHNVGLQMLMEFGLVGTLTLGGLVVSWWRKAPGWRPRLRAVWQEPEARAMVAVLAGFFAFGLVDGVFFFPVPLMHFVVLCALTLALAGRAVSASGHQNQPDDQ